MLDLIFQVSVGPPSRLYDFCTSSVADYAKGIGADHIIQTEAKLKIRPDPEKSGRSKGATGNFGGILPIFEKENAFDLFSHYDRIAIIDADIWVRPGSPSIFNQLGSADFAGVRERDTPSTEQHKRKIKGYSRSSFSSLKDVDWDWKDGVADFYNCGIMLMGNNFPSYLNGQSAKEFLSRPEFKKFVDGVGPHRWSTDQHLICYWIKKCGMKAKSLDWKWNALYGAVRGDRMKEAWFLHFFLRDKLPSKGENVEELVKLIK